MGGLASSIYDLIEGNPTEKEQADLASLANYQQGVGQGLTTAGAGYEEALLSGDPTRIAQALAPEISAGQGQVEQARLAGANFGTRSGGTAAATNAAEAGNRANIINLVGGLQQGTAGAAVGQGTGLIGGAASDQEARAQMAAARQAQTAGDIGGIAQGAAQIAAGFLGGAGGEGGTGANVADIVGAPMANPQAGVGTEPGYLSPTDTSGMAGPVPNFSVFDTAPPQVTQQQEYNWQD